MEMNSNDPENRGIVTRSDDRTFAFFYDSAGYKLFWKGLSHLLGWQSRNTIDPDEDRKEETPYDPS